MKHARFLALLVAVVMLVLPMGNMMAAGYSYEYSFDYADHFTVALDGEFVDMRPILVNGRTLLPVRQLAELVGCKVEWFAEEEKIVVYAPVIDEALIVMELFNTDVTVNSYDGNTGDIGGAVQTIDVPPLLAESRTYVPLRFVAEALGYHVSFIDNVIYLNSAFVEG